MSLYRSVTDFRVEDVDWILDRAARIKAGEPSAQLPPRAVVGLAFLESSLRTRTGFAAAAIRLGATPVEVLGVRESAVSMPESVDDTLRTLAGYCDAVVARVGEHLVLPAGVQVPLVSGGDRGLVAEHPTQALIDLFALTRLAVPVGDQVVALCGDLRMRAARSLLLLLEAYQPRRLVLVTEPGLHEGLTVPEGLATLCEERTLGDIGDVDALYVVGIPHGALDEDGRTRLRVTSAHLDSLPPRARVYSPLPVIDEMERDALHHPRVRMFEQSDDGLYVRMATLELVLGLGAPA
ncbi:hypothetical protein ASD62_03435 [Phycicoccus sp. Root563]|uniref:hypothetical protein n=1 Tax=Phycicoccus sp. Root563 TaxID=1736562 RepID=UPI000702EC87|nr:hypothetical protein [Phycicoccus sp. Root563]KQZ88511.1 hypothetical protein ASD62_03435 [Phycicoccus sp. Root563]